MVASRLARAPSFQIQALPQHPLFYITYPPHVLTSYCAKLRAHVILLTTYPDSAFQLHIGQSREDIKIVS